MEPINAYSAYWHAESDTGRIFLKLANGNTVHIDLDSPAELAALCAMLKANPQMVYDVEQKLLSTTWLKPGA